jgi:hypothetical protein
MYICNYYVPGIKKTAQVIKEKDRFNISILGISECRWTGTKESVSSNHTIILSRGADDQRNKRVGIIMNKESAKCLIEWKPINERLIKARFNSTYAKTTIFQCYSSTNDADREMKDVYNMKPYKHRLTKHLGMIFYW